MIPHDSTGGAAEAIPDVGTLRDIYVGNFSKTSTVQTVPDPIKPETPNFTELYQLYPDFEKKFNPLTVTTESLPAITADLLPSWLGDMAREVSKSTKNPEGLSVLLALSMVAIAIQRKFQIAVQGTDHIEETCLWTLGVLDSGAIKTKVFKDMRVPVAKFDRELRKRAEEKNATEEKSEKGTKARLPQLWTGNTTGETLEDLLAENDGKMAVLHDEGGIFEVVTGLYNNGKFNVDSFLDAYAGSDVRVNRQGRNVDIPHAVLSFGLCIQPIVLQRTKADTRDSLRGRGWYGRFLYWIGESTVGYRNVREKFQVTPEAKQAYEKHLRSLLSIAENKDDAGEPCPFTITLSKDAETAYLDFWQHLEDNQGPNGTYAPIRDWTAKAHGQLLRIAAILHVAEIVKGREAGIAQVIVNTPVSLETMTKAVELMRRLIPHSMAAYSMMGYVDANVVANSHRILERILETKPREIGERAIHNQLFKNLKKSTVERALDYLQLQGVLSEQLAVGKSRNPMLVRLVNPALYERLAS
jgi:hypothetical protein